MPTKIDYAFMAANVYGNSPDVRSAQNTLPTAGWTPVSTVVLRTASWRGRTRTAMT